MQDSLNDHLAQDALDSAMQGRTAVTISHRLSSVVTSDIIYVMQKGQVNWPVNRHREKHH